MAWQGSDGSEHASQYDRDFNEKINLGKEPGGGSGGSSGGVTDAGGGIMIAIFGPIFILGLIIALIYTFIKQYAFYILPIFGFLFFANLFLKVFREKFLVPVLALLLATVGTILFGKLIYYPYIIEPSTFTADYIVGEAAIHARRNGGGKELARLAEGEKVTVNGVSRDRKEFNITAKDGSTGWIPAAAFPEDANFPPDDASDIVLSNIPFVGHNKQTQFARDYFKNSPSVRDREWFNKMEAVAAAYFTTEEGGEAGLHAPRNTTYGDKFDDVWPSIDTYGVSANVYNRALRVNQPFNVTIHADRGSKGEQYKVFLGDVEMTLRYVLYAPEVTMIAFNRGDHEFADIFTEFYYDKEYHASLVLQDIDTGETFPFYRSITLSGGEVIYIFPPVKTRHFALIHEKPSAVQKVTETAAWDIPEVTIAANAPTMANDPLRLAQRRADNFKPDGSNAMTTNNLRLYPEEIPYWYPKDSEDFTAVYPEPLAVIPAGEVVTILEGSTNVVSKVKYKDLEGYVFYWLLKK